MTETPVTNRDVADAQRISQIMSDYGDLEMTVDILERESQCLLFVPNCYLSFDGCPKLDDHAQFQVSNLEEKAAVLFLTRRGYLVYKERSGLAVVVNALPEAI